METFVIYLCFEKKGTKTLERNNFVFLLCKINSITYCYHQFLRVLKIRVLPFENLLLEIPLVPEPGEPFQ